jgi:ankyrin repeat protein
MPLLSACKYDNKDVVDFLLEKKSKVDAIDKDGMTALHAACEKGNKDIVKSLLKCNSSVNLCDDYGFTLPPLGNFQIVFEMHLLQWCLKTCML